MKSKFQLGQKVWYIRFDEVRHQAISGLVNMTGKISASNSNFNCETEEGEVITRYFFGGTFDMMEEALLFETKEELMQHLFENIKGELDK